MGQGFRDLEPVPFSTGYVLQDDVALNVLGDLVADLFRRVGRGQPGNGGVSDFLDDLVLGL